MSIDITGDAGHIANAGATVIQLPIADDNVIPNITGFTLVDADPNVLARALRRRRWPARAKFFNNILHVSIINGIKMVEIVPAKKAGEALLDWGLVEMRRRIGEVIDLLGETEPPDAAAAAVFFLSLKPEHQTAAKTWAQPQPSGLPAGLVFFGSGAAKRWPDLGVFYRMFEFGCTFTRMAWRARPSPYPLAAEDVS